MPGDAGVTHLPGEPECWPNRPMSTRSRVVIVALLASAALIMGITDTIAHQDKIQRRDDLVELGIETRARVIAYRSNGRSSDLITIQLLDGPYEGFRGTRSVDRGPEASPGDVVTVFHASDDVNDLVIVGYDQDARSTGWYLAIATLVVGIWLWSTHRRAQAGKTTG